MLTLDKRLRRAVRPEEALGADAYLSSIASVVEVRLSNDLQVAKVYLSVYGDERGRRVAEERLRKQEGYLRLRIGQNIRLRRTPEIRLMFTDSFHQGTKVLALLEQLERDRSGGFRTMAEAEADAAAKAAASGDEEEYDEDELWDEFEEEEEDAEALSDGEEEEQEEDGVTVIR